MFDSLPDRFFVRRVTLVPNSHTEPEITHADILHLVQGNGMYDEATIRAQSHRVLTV